MNPTDEDKNLNDLYQVANQELPPKEVDRLILQQAHQSTQLNNNTNQIKQNWRPWMAAASVMLVIPLVWLMIQNQQLLSDGSETSILTEKPLIKSQTQSNTVDAFTDGLDYATEQGNSSNNRTRRMQQGPVSTLAPVVETNLATTSDNESADVDKSINKLSLQANKNLLMNELKGKKKTIKKSNMDPIMSLSNQQFNQLLKQGELIAAEQLLAQMQQDYPDFNFEDLVNRLNTAKNQ